MKNIILAIMLFTLCVDSAFAHGITTEVAILIIVMFFWPSIVFLALLGIAITRTYKGNPDKKYYVAAVMLLFIQLPWYFGLEAYL